MSRHFAVFGHPVAHSLSPRIHAAFGKQAGIDIDYVAIDAQAGDFAAALAAFAARGGAGANVTLPLKEAAFALCADTSERARRAGAVNTLVRNGDDWHGDNTDGAGLVRDLTVNAGFSLKGKRILVLGAGGAVRGALEPILAEGPASVTIANRTVEKAELLAELFSDLGPVAASGFDWLHEPVDLIINATSASLSGELPPIASSLIEPGKTLCYDMMYGKEPTPFCVWASGHGAGQVMDGLGMLAEQAAEAFYLWRGVRPDTAPALAELRRLLAL